MKSQWEKGVLPSTTMETLKIWQHERMRGWAAADESKQVAAISSGPACHGRGAPGMPERKETELITERVGKPRQGKQVLNSKSS